MSLKELFIKWVWQYLFWHPNYSIRDIQAIYEVSSGDEPVDMLRMVPFWGSQNLEKGTVQTISIHKRIWKPVPENIYIHSVFISYWYNGKTYTYVPEKYDINWPPKNTLKFHMPIKNAVLLDDKDRIIFDLTDVIKKFAGPKGDSSFLNRIKSLRLTDVLGTCTHSSVFVAK